MEGEDVVDYTEPNFSRCAVITIDTQNDFSLPGAIAEIKGTHEVIPQMKRILEAARKSHIPILHVVRIYKEDGSNADICRKALIESGAQIVSPGSSGAELVDSIKPSSDANLSHEELLSGKMQPLGDLEWAMYKPRWGAFYQTDLEDFLRGKGIDSLVFIGCNFPNCPRASMVQASERDFKVVMIEDAISGVYPQGIEELIRIGVKAYTTEQVISQFK
ncbi:isochorismatase [Bacillus sp. FJAT-18019]|nr:isochorismatase [Bacillus sp. FJAT-18019]